MKKFGRLLAFVLVLVMLATMAVSCRKNDDDTEEGGGTKTVNGVTYDENGEIIDEGSGTSGKSGKSGKSGTSGGESTKGNTVINSDGTVKNTDTQLTVDENFHINEAVTNTQNFIPDEEQGLEKSERRATAESKYDFNKNPLINRDRQENRNAMPSFNINDTGFVRSGTKLSDLKGKTLAFYTSGDDAIWSYKNAKGEYVSEFQWFDSLKKEIGLTIKKTETFHEYAISEPLKAMNAGKQCDLIYANNVTWPTALTISKSITDITNIAKGTSPGVCKKTMDILKWGNTYRVIAPIGEANVLWYNQTLAQELGLSDPHKMWEAKQWNWDSFKKFMQQIPKVNQKGEKLIALAEWQSDNAYVWPGTNGPLHIYNDPNADKPTIRNNWDGDTVMQAWEFIASVCNSIQFSSSTPGTASDYKSQCYRGLFQGTTLMASTMQVQKYIDTEYSKNVRIHWVPFPNSGRAGGRDIAQFRGYAMLLPRKTIKASNQDIALKFMELWATRFTEAIFDNLSVYEYHAFDYFMRKQYFDFVTEDVVFHMACNDFHGTTIFEDTNFFNSLDGQPQYNVRTEATKARNIVKNHIDAQMKFGD